MEGKGSLEDQLEAVKNKASEVATRKDMLRKVEELGANIEEALIFDNKYA
jgi:spectrin alpha